MRKTERLDWDVDIQTEYLDWNVDILMWRLHSVHASLVQPVSRCSTRSQVVPDQLNSYFLILSNSKTKKCNFVFPPKIKTINYL
jgi:hypothetical protein